MTEPNWNKLVFFDTETVSINPNFIISLAYIAYEDGKRTGYGEIICNPDYPINPEASKVNGFTDEMVADKPLFDEQWPTVEKYFSDAIWIGHNIGFDVRAVRREAKRYEIDLPQHWTLDTLKNARLIIPKSEVENYKLETLCNHFNITLDNYHNSLIDTYACLRVYNELVRLSNGNLLVE